MAISHQPYRIGVGGIAIESSTFSPLPSRLDDFTVLRGNELRARYPFMPDWRFRGRTDIAWQPCLHARALPGGPVTRETYDALKRELLDRVRAALPLDGFYLDIHGAMSVLGMDDAEADLAEAIRAVVGPACQISAGMDLHGNVSARLVAAVDLFTAYRHAPHIDAIETRERACANLLHCLDAGVRPLRAWVRIPVILPGERTSTRVEPARTLYADLAASNGAPGVLDASLWVGYVWADEPRSSATVVVTGSERGRISDEAAKIARRYWDARNAFGFCVPAGPADWCIEQALAAPAQPVVISDAGDNPTAGGAGDVPFMLARLLAQPAFAAGERTAIYAGLADGAAVAACFSAGRGATIALSLGGKLDPVHGRPLDLRAEVAALAPGDPVGGDSAVVRVGGVHAIVTSRRKPFHRAGDFTSLGLDPKGVDVVVVKIGYLEPELQALARSAYLALTPGAVNQDIPRLRYRRVPRPIYPLDPDMPDPDLTPLVFEARRS